MKLCNGWLDVRQCPSPNYDERPLGMAIDLVVIHGISLPPEVFGGDYIDDFFTNALDKSVHPYFEEIASLRVSAHCLINRAGQVTQYVSFDKRAWHAGQSVFQERENCNDFAIGIELEGADSIPYEGVQYDVLAELIALLQMQYPGITQERIVGHSDIAPGRKTDPGEAFDWQRLTQLLIH